MRRASDALENQSGEEGRGDDELTPLGVERRCGLSGNRLIERAALLLELRDLVADRDKHVPISQELRLVLTGLPWPGMTIVLSRAANPVRLGGTYQRQQRVRGTTAITLPMAQNVEL